MRNIVTLKDIIRSSLHIKKINNACFFSSRVLRSRSNEFEKYQVEAGTDRYLRASFSKVSDLEKLKKTKSNCLVTLSIGQPVHERAHLAATLSLINSNFSSCTFVLGDTLQRHTMKIIEPSSTSEQLLVKSEKKGDFWIQNNGHLLSMLRIPWNVKRWDYWLEHDRFSSLLEKVQFIYQAEPKYKAAFDENITAYIFRLKSRGELNINESEAYKKCLDYLQEECAAMCLWVEEGCKYELYANGRTEAMQATYERFIEVMYPNLLIPIALRFKKLPIDLGKDSTQAKEETINESARSYIT